MTELGDVLLQTFALSGMFVGLAAPIMVLALVVPSLRSLPDDPDTLATARRLAASAARWGAGASVIAGSATLLELPSWVAEIEDTTILAGIDPRLVVRFALTMVTGRLALIEAFSLLAAAWVIARHIRRDPLCASGAWGVAAGLAGVALVAHGLASHAAAQPFGRELAIATELGHLLAGAVWIGILGHFLAARITLRRATAPGARRLVAGMVARFSLLAAASAGLLGVSGMFAAWRYLDTPAALLTSTYGLTLVTKLALTLLLVAAGFVNFRLVRPALSDTLDPKAALARLCRMLELEVTAGALVIAVAAILATVVPPGGDGALRLTGAEVRAFLTPTLPGMTIGDPMTWLDAPTRTVEDLRYAEFTHHWSGVATCLLGLAWLAQQRGGRFGRRVGWIWPAALIPYALFILLASDPEFWPLGPVALSAGFASPKVLGHRFGAGLVVLLALLGWRAMARRAPHQPLGYALPVILITGSLTLLGHGHQGVASAERLDTLVGVQHAIMGALGLFAGVVRWLDLRGFLPRRVAAILWPSLIVLLGGFMAFWYQEVI